MTKIGIIGCGKIAEVRHLPEYKLNRHAVLVGCCDFIADRAKNTADKYGGIAFSSYEELIACKDIDAVSICSANTTHAEIAIAALRAGKHVLCEKPMATTIEDCERMLSEAKKAGKHLMIAHNQRLWESHQKAKELIKSGVIGKPITFKTCFGHRGPDFWSVDKGTGNWFFDKSKSAFGVTADLGIHKIDLIRFLLGEEITEVMAMAGTLDKKDADGKPVSVEDNTILLCRMESGIFGTISASWTCYGDEENGTVIYGSEGSLHISDADAPIKVIRFGKEPEIFDVPKQTVSGVINAFVDTVITDNVCPISAESVIPSMKVMFAALESAKIEKSVHLD